MIRQFFFAVGGILFLASMAAYVWAWLRLRPRHDREMEEMYWEFEDQHPALARYDKWRQITLAGAILGALLLVAAMMAL